MKLALTLPLALGLTVLSTANGAVIGVTGGTAAPSTTLGGYTMTPFPDDPRANFTLVSGVTSPLGGTLGFTPSLELRSIGAGWATWSHGYTGDVYYGEDLTSMTLTLPTGTGAFYFYAEPDLFGTFTVTATEASGTQVSQSVASSSGASYFGFYGTAGSTLSSITVTAPAGAGGFAVGEFGIATTQTRGVPDTGASIALLVVAFLGLGVMQRRLRVARV
jgi:hypothetical protein